MRIGLGPVFAYEWLRTARNWRVYLVRVLFGLGLLTVLAMVAQSNQQQRQYRNLSEIREQAEAGKAFSAAIIITQLSLILLVAPAATAGAICLDKQRGALAHVLATDLTDAEIVLGKLAARLLPPIGLVVGSLGIMALCTLMGGVDPVGLIGALLVTLGVTVLASTLALFVSVWASKTHEAIMVTYVVLLAWMLFYPLWYGMSFSGVGIPRPPQWLELAHPFWLVANDRPGAVPLHLHVSFLLGCLAASALLAAVATRKIRAVAVRQMNRPARVRRSWWRRALRTDRVALIATERRRRSPLRWLGPSLDGNPVLWREWHRKQPSRWSRAIWMLYAGCSLLGTAFGVWVLFEAKGRGTTEGVMILGLGLMISVGLLLLSVSSATALAEERVRGSLDVLMTTPLATRRLVMGKWWGAFRSVPLLSVLPGFLILAGVYFRDDSAVRRAVPLPAYAGAGDDWQRYLAVPLVMGLTVAYGAALTSFGLAMATWISRLERSVSATVAAYVFMAVGWMFLVMMIFDEERLGVGLATASPFLGPAYLGALVGMPVNMSDYEQRWAQEMGWGVFWTLAYVTVAAVLLKLTLLTFDRKLGRTPENGMRRRPTPEAPRAKREEAMVAV